MVLAGGCASGTPASPPVVEPSTDPVVLEPTMPTPAPVEPAVAVEPSVGSAPVVQLDTSGSKTHYLVELSLSREDLVTEGPLAEREMAYTLVDGGQFEIYVRPEVIPVPNPGCAQAIIVRMPWTNPDAPQATEAVEAKRKLFLRVDDLLTHGTGELRVAVQLDPYVAVADDDAAKVSLTQCTVFFRYATEAYAYIDHTGPLGRP